MPTATGKEGPRPAGRDRSAPAWRHPLRIALVAAVLAAWLVDFSMSLGSTRRVQLSDFAGYYGAATVVLAGEPQGLYESERKWFTNLPIVAVMLSPLATLEYRAAWNLFWWLQLLCFGATLAVLLWGVSRHLAPLDAAGAAAALAVFLAFGPVLRRCLELGQTTPLVLLLVSLTWLAARAGRSKLAGLALGVVCLVKIPPLLWVALFAARRRLALAGTALAVVGLGVALSWLLFGSDLMSQYAERVIWSNAGASHAAFNNRSLDGAFTRLLTDRGLLDWDPAPRPWPVLLAFLATALGLVALYLARGALRLLWPPEPPRDDDARTGSLELEIAIGAVVMVLALPIVWIHYYLFLALPLALLPFWWRARALPLSLASITLLVVGGWLASGTDTPGNVEVGQRRNEPGYRLTHNAQPLGAVLIALGLSTPVAVLAQRSRATNGR